jgi:hypothetical protein
MTGKQRREKARERMRKIRNAETFVYRSFLEFMLNVRWFDLSNI